MSHRTAVAPAKVNLGLEIIGRRADGFHEVRTILCAVSLHDSLAFEPADAPNDLIVMQSGKDIPVSGNLVMKTMRALRTAGADIPSQRITVTKRIPIAAGLGGASSDAAAVIRAFSTELTAAGGHAHALAADLGSDVPFFLGESLALAAGRGEKLTPLTPPASHSWVVLARPMLDIAEKTRTMYQAIEPAWWSDGKEVLRIAQSLPSLPVSAPYNVFERAALRLYPQLDTYRNRLLEAGFPWVALTGSGPTFYTLVSSSETAERLGQTLTEDGIDAYVAKLGLAGED